MAEAEKRMDTGLAGQLSRVWRLSVPAILTQITSIVMQYIDSAMVGRLGPGASAAIGLVSSSTWLMSGFIYGVSAGFSVQVAHHIGAKEEAEARRVLKHGLATGLILSTLLLFAGAALSAPLPHWLGGDADILADASAYFLVFALTFPFMQMNSLASSCLQCSGNMVTPSILNAIMCGLDVLFNAVFIPRLGVLGAGIGTGLATAVISMAMLWCCCVRSKTLRLTRRESCPLDTGILRRALKIGSPVAGQELAMCGAMVASTRIIAPLGTAAIAANSFAVTAESLCYMPGYGIGSAATTLVGQSMGAGECRLAKRYANIATAFGAVGHFRRNTDASGRSYPVILVNQEEHMVDVQEMAVWSVLNWRFLRLEQIELKYSQLASDLPPARRTLETCLNRLEMRGLIARGGTGRIRVYGVPDYEYADVTLDKSGGLDCSIVKIVPVQGGQPALDPSAWFELEGRDVLDGIIADLRSRGHSSLTLNEDGSISFQPEAGGRKATKRTFATFPEKVYWPRLADVLAQEGLTADVQADHIAVSW